MLIPDMMCDGNKHERYKQAFVPNGNDMGVMILIPVAELCSSDAMSLGNSSRYATHGSNQYAC